ncbi:MAG: MOSC N-terminal beta barrel domain-containing protein [Steroidobacteraceae bacterium]
MSITLTGLCIYPVKSCRGIEVPHARLTATGLDHDREWMIVTPAGRFVTQREEPRLALINTWLDDEGLQIELPGAGELFIPFNTKGEATTATVWNDRCGAFDMGAQAADLLAAYLGTPHRLVRFNPAGRRTSNPEWTGERQALNQFSDGFPLLAVSEASLAHLNQKLPAPLPMNRFRPNLVFSGLDPYGEDAVSKLTDGAVTLQAVKPCTRCKITTIDQKTGIASGTEPLSTLRSYRLSKHPLGVLFGQNMIPLDGIGEMLGIGQTFTPTWR